MLAIPRTDTSLLGRWWWTVDRWTLAALLTLMALGALLVAAASPAVADRIGAPTFYFVERHLTMLAPAVLLMIGVSLATPVQIRRGAMLGLLGCMVLMAGVLLLGEEVKGARRWLSIAGFSLQPSEFMKPLFAVTAAWFLAREKQSERFPGHAIALALYALFAGLLVLQPDFGMSVVLTAIFGAQLFLAGLPIVLVILAAVLSAVGIVAVYFTLPHVAQRIDTFLDPQSGDTYQVTRSLEAFAHGGWFGTGPGQGVVKGALPDAHADFIFAVAGEELGAITAILIVAIFGFIVLRGFARAVRKDDLFITLAAGGLLVQFGLQALIHMGSALHLFPTKGMTLPFLSYGGSSLLALGLGMGMLLALTRMQFHSKTGEWR
jgi:cell division protein FtsW